MPKQLKPKIKSLKIYLDTIYSLVAEDCIDPKFIENIKLICQCALAGCSHLDKELDSQIPDFMKHNWVYILMWIAKDICMTSQENRSMENAIVAIEKKILDIFLQLSSYRTNLQVQKFLLNFRKFAENNLDPTAEASQSIDMELEFQNIFKLYQFDIDYRLTDKFLRLKKKEIEKHSMKLEGKPLRERGGPDEYTHKKIALELEEQYSTKKIPFDMIFMNYIFQNKTNQEVRKKALEVLIKNFNQRDLLVKELSRTDIIVSVEDYRLYINFLSKHRQLNQLTNKLIQDEMYCMIYKKGASPETKNTRNDIINILTTMSKDLRKADELDRLKLQNMLRHIGMLSDILNTLMKKLIYKEIIYKDLNQTCIDFFFECCFDNASCQQLLLPELNFFLDILNKKIETGTLISEIIKCNSDVNYSQSFAKYLINKIINESYFKSGLFRQLIKIAENRKTHDQPDNFFLKNASEQKEEENPNQQFILKQIIKSSRFRALLMMRKSLTSKKMGIIKTYAKKRQQYNTTKKDVDEQLLEDKENLDLHLAVIDLLSACARNSPFCISQAQKLIECEELLDSLLSDAIPYIMKQHYFKLLYEVYLRKVPGLDDTHRLSVTDQKFALVMEYVVLYDIDHSYIYYNGLVKDPAPQDTPEMTRKLRQVNREIEKASEAEYLLKNEGKTEEEIEEAKRLKSTLTSHKETSVLHVFDSSDRSEYWRYLYEFSAQDRRHDGLITFIENFYRDYSVRELEDSKMIQITTMIRERLLAIANKIFTFVDTHESHIKPYVHNLLNMMNKAILKIPHIRTFIGSKKVLKDGKMLDQAGLSQYDDNYNVDESRDVDNRMNGDKVLRLLRDYIIKNSTSIKDALPIQGISSDHMVNRDTLKVAIKNITGAYASYEEIMKALDYFNTISLEKKQEKQLLNVDAPPGNFENKRGEQHSIAENDPKLNRINFKDFELQLKDALKKAGYKAPTVQKGDKFADDGLQLNISPQDYSLAINMDLKLFTQRFFEFIHMTKNFFEIHEFVNKLMQSEMIKSRQAKVQLVKNLLVGFLGLKGDDDELVLTSILNLIIQRLIPDEEDFSTSQTLVQQKTEKKKNDLKQNELREWQDVMFEAGVPDLMITFIKMSIGNVYLSNKAIILLNNMLCHSSEANQKKMLQILQNDNQFFEVFHYVKTRIEASKVYMLEKIKRGAQQKFINQNIKESSKNLQFKPNDFMSQKMFLEPKYDVERKYEELSLSWKEDEMNNLLKFLNSLCENCYQPAQLFLREQIKDQNTNFKDLNRGKITSIDLIYVVVCTFIEIVDTLGDYVFSDYRTFKLIPYIMDTMIEFIYGPCIENQQFLGGWKKLMSVINTLMDQKEMGNYSGIHQEAKAQLTILHSCSQVLLAITDIKHEEIAKKTHMLILAEIDIQNLINKMVDIYIYKIGGSEEKKRIYDFDIKCSHFNDKDPSDKESRCIEDEFCQFGHFIPRDKNVI